MQNDIGHFQEDALGKPYDVRLMRRFLAFTRPYLRLIGFVFILILLLTALDLTLPYLTKIGIDRYIFPSAQRMEFMDLSESRAQAFIRTYGRLLKPGEKAGVYYLPSEEMKRIDPKDLGAVRK